jgi:RES domain-containing protein
MSRYQPPEQMAARHLLTDFRCRSEEQTTWLVEVAKKAHGTGTTRVFVVTEVNQPQVVAYYAWCMASVAMSIGSAWLERRSSVALRVPSVVVPMESNVLLNPRHPEMARVRISSNEAFRFDSRLR